MVERWACESKQRVGYVPVPIFQLSVVHTGVYVFFTLHIVLFKGIFKVCFVRRTHGTVADVIARQ